MTKTELERRQERADTEICIIVKADDGFRVYSPLAPANQYVVTGIPGTPHCTCPDFQNHASDPDWRCKHILAVLQNGSGEATQPGVGTPSEAIPSSTGPTQPPKRDRKPAATANSNGTAQMLLKRSVSPDGRIDSLSVEFSCPVNQASIGEIKQQADKTLKLQSEIVTSFLNNGNGKGPDKPVATANSADDNNGAVPAQLLDIGGMNTRRGWRLFINIEVNGQTAKLFGSDKQLADHVASAGYPQQAQQVKAGLRLNLPCLVIIQPSKDGRFINIERVMPAASAGQGRARP